MIKSNTIEKLISVLLLTGTLSSLIIVLIGGSWYLSEYGQNDMQFELLTVDNTTHTIQQIWQMALSFTSLGIIQFGLLLLVATQSLRVSLLCFYYLQKRDYIFSCISAFILFVLIYCTFWRN